MKSRTVRQAESIREGVCVSWVLMGVVVGVMGSVLCWSTPRKGVEVLGGGDRVAGLVVARGMGYFEGGVGCLDGVAVSGLGGRVEGALEGVLTVEERESERGVGRALGRMESGEWMGETRCDLVRSGWREVSGSVGR